MHAHGMGKKESSRPAARKEVHPLAELLAANIQKFLEAGGLEQQAIKTLMSGGLTNGTAGRLKTPDGTAVRLEYIDQAAKGLGAQPWQLLLPDLQVSKANGVVSTEGMRARQWPFPTLQRSEVENLTPTEMTRLEKTIRARIAEILDDRRALGGGPPVETSQKAAKA